MGDRVVEVLPGTFVTIPDGPYSRLSPDQVRKQAQYMGASRTSPFVPTSKPAGEMTAGDWIDQAAISTAAIPALGDVVGFGADIYHMAREPSLENALWAGAGLLPFVPATSARRTLGKSKNALNPKGSSIKEGPNSFDEVAFAQAMDDLDAGERWVEIPSTNAPNAAPRSSVNNLWRIWDRKEKKWASAPYKNKKRARTRMDRLDNEYGAYRYQVKEYKD